jgi:hypothetical protein
VRGIEFWSPAGPASANRRSASPVPPDPVQLNTRPTRTHIDTFSTPPRLRAPEKCFFNNLRSRLFFEVKESDLLLEI